MDNVCGDIVESILGRLARAWNAADGSAWGAEFTDDADFVNVFGAQMRGRGEIEQRHQYLFDALFKGSTVVDFPVADARLLAPNVILAHSTAVVRIPAGPMAGEHSSRQTVVLLQEESRTWRIAAVHNTSITLQL
jgi:uncharacterized protein (TIGR02246 family)